MEKPTKKQLDFIKVIEEEWDRVLKKTKDTKETPHDHLHIFKTLLNRAKNNRLRIK